MPEVRPTIGQPEELSRFPATNAGPPADSRQLAEWLRLACVLEVLSPKPGNVHPAAPFEDLCAADFLVAAGCAVPVLAAVGTQNDSAGPTPTNGSVGATVLEAVRRTVAATGTTVNLGMVLLLAPLAAVPRDTRLTEGVEAVLKSLTSADAAAVYEAIRLARPGGLGRSGSHDVHAAPPDDLLAAMRAAAERDLVAAEYARGFPVALSAAADILGDQPPTADNWREAIIHLQLVLMARHPDSLIARKCGPAVAREAATRAGDVLAAGWPNRAGCDGVLRELDCWLRADGHRRNPGTTADVVAAALFAGGASFKVG